MTSAGSGLSAYLATFDSAARVGWEPQTRRFEGPIDRAAAEDGSKWEGRVELQLRRGPLTECGLCVGSHAGQRRVTG